MGVLSLIFMYDIERLKAPSFDRSQIQYFGHLDPKKSHHALLKDNRIGIWDRLQMTCWPRTRLINPDQEYWRDLKYERLRTSFNTDIGLGRHWSRFQMISGL